MTTDEQLLQQYARERSESAFGELVTRHLDYVYSAALRVANGDAPLAQDVTQTVFIELARQGRSLPPEVALTAWLHRHTCYTAAKAVRTERRRQTREQTALEMRALDDHTRPEWEQVAPYLDESLNQLNPPDRDALVLRFLKQQDLRTVGEALGISEDAAQKRVDRALEKLHVLLKQRGATLSLAALGTALATQAVTAAPVGLAGSIAAAALASAAAGGGITASLVKLMTMTKVKLGIIGVIAVVGVATPLAIRHQSQSSLRETNQALRQQAQQLAQQQADNERLSNLLAQANASQLSSSNQLKELLNLRAEVGLLRGQNKELARLRDENHPLQSGLTPSQDTRIPAGAINFNNADLQQVLGIYGSLADAELVVGPGVRLPPALITLSNEQPLTHAEALSHIKGALRDRAGLVVEHQDAKHFTVKPAK